MQRTAVLALCLMGLLGVACAGNLLYGDGYGYGYKGFPYGGRLGYKGFPYGGVGGRGFLFGNNYYPYNKGYGYGYPNKGYGYGYPKYGYGYNKGYGYGKPGFYGYGYGKNYGYYGNY